MRESVPFRVSVRPHLDVWQSALDVHWDDITIEGLDNLFPTNLYGAVINLLLVPFELTGRVNSLSFSSVGILMEDGNDITTLGFDNSSGSDDGNVNNLVVVNALDVNLSAGTVDHADIIASNATIGASIDKCTSSNLTVAGDTVLDVLVGSIGNTIKHHSLAPAHGLRKDSCDITGGDILFLRHVSQEWLIWGVRFWGNEKGWELKVTRSICNRLVEVSQILQGTDLMQVDGSVWGAWARNKSTARGLGEITPRGATTMVARGLPHLLFENNCLVLTVKFVPFDLCILRETAPLVSI